MREWKFFLVSLVAFAFLTSTSFAAAQWLNTAALALAASFAILGVTYAIGIGFNMSDLKFLANEEAYQLVVTVVMIGLLFGAQNYLDSLAKAMNMPGKTTGSYATTMQDGSINMIDQLLKNHKTMYDKLNDFSVALGKESSKSYYCSLQGAGFTANPCGALRALATPVSTCFQALGASIVELGSLRTLAQFAGNYAFTLLLPVGILLRTFKLTRGGGGLFIGLAVALYLFLPISLAFMNVVMDPTTGYNPSPMITSVTDMSLSPTPSCSEDAFGTWGGGVDYSNYDDATKVFGTTATQGLRGKITLYVYYFLIRGTLVTIVALLSVYASLRAVSKLAGAEIDISALARIA